MFPPQTTIIPNSIGPLSYVENRKYEKSFNFFNITSADPFQKFDYSFTLMPSGTSLPSWIAVNSTSITINGSGSQIGNITVRISISPTPCIKNVTNDIQISIVKNNPPTFGSSGTFIF